MTPMKEARLTGSAVIVTLLFVALTSLWWYHPGRERPLGWRSPWVRGVPVMALQGYRPGVTLELDGKIVPTRYSRESELRLSYLRNSRAGYRKRGIADPVVPSGGRSVDVTFLQPTDGPRPGSWVREEHWAKATWSAGDGSRQERVLNISAMFRGLERDLSPGRSVQFVLMDMWTPLGPYNSWICAWAALALLSAWMAFVGGACLGHLPRVLLGQTLAALVLGPFWFVAAWLWRVDRYRRIAG